jgi:hypothetical protein
VSAEGPPVAVQWLCIVRCSAHRLVIVAAVTTQLQADASILWLLYCMKGSSYTSVVSYCCG